MINIDALKKNKNVESVIHFGSSLKSKLYRDIDLCIITVKKISFKEKLKLLRNLPVKYDISFYDDLPLNVKQSVISEGKIIFTRNYYRILQEIAYLEREYPRYARFLEDYHQTTMAKLKEAVA
ncbi:hypothetical protein J4437_00685 [Candidatus Woesearchaeota archaeon]|nr:hypothetical protein [Candidatus Woesearchaeota archaeon]